MASMLLLRLRSRMRMLYRRLIRLLAPDRLRNDYKVILIYYAVNDCDYLASGAVALAVGAVSKPQARRCRMDMADMRNAGNSGYHRARTGFPAAFQGQEKR